MLSTATLIGVILDSTIQINKNLNLFFSFCSFAFNNQQEASNFVNN